MMPENQSERIEVARALGIRAAQENRPCYLLYENPDFRALCKGIHHNNLIELVRAFVDGYQMQKALSGGGDAQ